MEKVAIPNNPYEGLKRPDIYANGNLSRVVAIPNNPYEGLKPFSRLWLFFP